MTRTPHPIVVPLAQAVSDLIDLCQDPCDMSAADLASAEALAEEAADHAADIRRAMSDELDNLSDRLPGWVGEPAE